MIQELLSGGSATNSTRLLGDRTISNSLFISNTCPSSSPLLNTSNNNNITSITTSTLPYTTTAVANSANSAGGASENNSNNNNNNNNGTNETNNNNNNNNNNNSNGNSSQNLRCPRCDSTNTKFCYYNNYNLTQPRHFCKTCRRYWTKGGTLRNVPIGGGCRKNKSTISTNSSPSSMSSKSSNHHPNNNFLAKCSKTAFASDMLVNDHNSLFLGNGLLDNPFHTPGPNPLLWSSSPPQSQNTSHILALLRGSNNPFSNPNNPNPNSGSSVFTTLGLDSYASNGAPSSLLGSFTRTTNQQTHLLNGFAPDFVENNHGSSNIMDLYQRLKSSSSPSNNYGYNCSNSENSGSALLGHMVGSSTTNSSSSSSTMMNSNAFETTSLGGGAGGDHLGGYGFMMSASPAFSSWSEFPAVPINGAYP